MAAVSMPAMNSMATASPSIPNEPNDSSIDIIVNLLRSCASVQEFALACQMLTCVFLSSGSMSGLSPQLGGSFSAGSDSDSTADTAAGRSIRDELTTLISLVEFSAHVFRLRILPRSLNLWLLSRPAEDDEDETLTSTSHTNASEHPPGFQEFLKLLEVANAHIDAYGDIMLQRKMHLVMSSIYTPEVDDPTTPASTDGPLPQNDADPDIAMCISPNINDSQDDTLLFNIQRYAAGTFPAAETEAYFNSLSMEELHAALEIITATINNNVLATLIAPTHFDASLPASNSSLFVNPTSQGQSDSASAHIPSFHSMYLQQQALANPSPTSIRGVPRSTSVNGDLSTPKGTLAQRRGQLQRSLSLHNPPTVNPVHPFPQRRASAPTTRTLISPTPSTTDVAAPTFTTEAGAMTESITLPQLFPTYSHFLSQISEILPISPVSNSSAAHMVAGVYTLSGEGSGGNTVVNDLLASQGVSDPGFIEDMAVYFKDGFAETWPFDGVNMNCGGSWTGDVASAPGIGLGASNRGQSGSLVGATTANNDINTSNVISSASSKKNTRSISSVGPASSALNLSTSGSSTRRKHLKPLDAAKFSEHKRANSDGPQPPTPVIGECSESVLPMCVRPQSKLPLGVVEKHGRIRTKRESLSGESEKGRGSKRFKAMVESPLNESVVFGEIGGEEEGRTKTDPGESSRMQAGTSMSTSPVFEGSAQDGTGLGLAGLPSMRTNSSPVILSGPGFYPNPSTNASNSQDFSYYHHAPLVPILQTSYSSSFYSRLPNPYSPPVPQGARTTDGFTSTPSRSTPTPRRNRQRECSPLFTPRLAQEESGLHAGSLSQAMLVPSSSPLSSASIPVLDIEADTTGNDLGDNDHVSSAATNPSKMDIGSDAPPALGVLNTSSSMNTTLSSLAPSESMSKRLVSGIGRQSTSNILDSKDVELGGVQSMKEGISLSTVMELDETPSTLARTKTGTEVREKGQDKENSVARGVAHDGVGV